MEREQTEVFRREALAVIAAWRYDNPHHVPFAQLLARTADELEWAGWIVTERDRIVFSELTRGLRLNPNRDAAWIDNLVRSIRQNGAPILLERAGTTPSWNVGRRHASCG